MKIDLNTKHLTVYVEWAEIDSCTELTLHNKSIAEALEEAEFFGFKKPSWWQFWKPKQPYIRVGFGTDVVVIDGVKVWI